MGINNFQTPKVSGELYYITKYIKPLAKPVIFDVGANKGDFTKFILSQNPAATCYLFEPHPTTFKSISQYASLPVKAFNIGFGDRISEEILYDYEGENNEHASLVKEVITEFHSAQSKSHKVEISTLDTFVYQHSISNIDLLKIDTEGFEYKVLLGGLETIKSGIVKYIHFEFNSMNVYSGVFFKNIYDTLNPLYDIYRMMPDGLLKIASYEPVLHEIFAFQNYFAIKK